VGGINWYIHINEYFLTHNYKFLKVYLLEYRSDQDLFALLLFICLINRIIEFSKNNLLPRFGIGESHSILNLGQLSR